MWKLIIGKICKILRSIFRRTGKSVSVNVNSENVTIVIDRHEEGDDVNDGESNSLLESSGD